ncbi:hypothetical protein BD770DRAFT_408553 [Pilaira anomala]|nr:hypothetical protein BD770DRAFT_408553 [Pilaira anomala]
MSRPPPLKKRFTTGFNSPLTREEEEKNELTELSTNIENFSKQELVENMRSTKEEYLVEKRKALFEDTFDLMQPTVNTILLQLNLLRDEFVSAAKVIVDPSLPTIPSSSNPSLLLEEIERLAIDIVNELKSWANQFRNSQTNRQEWVRFIQSETTDMSRPNQYRIELENEYSFKLEQIDSVLKNIYSLSTQLNDTKEELEDCVESIESLEKRMDRAQSKIVSEMMRDGKEEKLVSMSPLKTEDVSGKTTTMTHHQEVEEWKEYQLLLEIRAKEYQLFAKDIHSLRDKLSILTRQAETMNEDKILNSNYVHHLESSIDFHYSRIHYYKQKIIDLESEQERLKIAQKATKDQFESEKKFQEASWISELKTLKNNLERITSQYQNLKLAVQDQLLRENSAKEKSTFIINDVETQRQKIIQLEKQIELLNTDDELSAKEEAEKVKQLTKKIKPINMDPLQQRLEKLSNTHGDQMNILNHLLEQKQAILLMIDFFENTERQLYARIDGDGRVYDARMSLMTVQINNKREHKLRLQAENIKYCQTFPGLKHEREKLKKKINNLKRITQQQADLISSKEKDEQDLAEQVNKQEVLIRELEYKIENCRLEVDDYTQQSQELEKRLKVNESQLLQLQKLAIEKIKSLDQEVALGKQTRSNYEKVKRKWTMISNGENPASQELIDEVEELRAQFKCSICKTRTRKCILLSCFHTFCHECIRIRLETRQRRCPSCAINFGASDVKEFYLYNTQ